MIEYALIAALISIVAIASLSSVGSANRTLLSCANNVLLGVYKDDGIGTCAPWETNN